MIRPVRADGSIETGGVFVPITRRRVIDRIASAAMQRVVLIVAPAGYGKSVALRQYLATIDAPCVRFDVLADHGGLLGFLRGFSDALVDVAPDARTTLPGAYEKNAGSASVGSDLALWMYSHIKSYRGIVAIDDLHIAQEDREVTRFLSSLIDRTKGRIQWILASRSTLGLPIGTWLAYGDSDLAIDEHDLKFSPEEARDAAKAFRLAVRDDELYELLNLTDGWATAMSFALRSSTRSVDLRNVSSMTREMIYRYLAEQVYETLNEEERRFIETAALLPRVDLDAMVRFGFDRAGAMMEELRQRVAFIHEPEPGEYRLHDLFREFALRQFKNRGREATVAVVASLARILASKGDVAHSLRLFIEAGDSESAQAYLEEHGLDLVARGFPDDVEAALAMLTDAGRAVPVIALLRATIALARGHYSEGEVLLRTTLPRVENPALRADGQLRLGLLLANRSEDPTPILSDLIADPTVDADRKIEARALLGGYLASAGDFESSRKEVAEVEARLNDIRDQERLARIVQRLGFAYARLDEAALATERSKQAAELAASRGLWSLAARAYMQLSVTALFDDEHPSLSLWNAQQAANAATRAGDYYDLQTSLLMVLSMETRRGNVDRIQQVEKQLAELGSGDPSRAYFIASSQAQRHVWSGRYADAHRLLGSVVGRQPHAADRAFVQSLYALALAFDGQGRSSGQAAAATSSLLEEATAVPYRHGSLVMEAARLFAILAEIVGGRLTAATRMLKKKPLSNREIARTMYELIEDLLRLARSPSYEIEDFDRRIDLLRDFGFGGYGRYFVIARERLDAQTSEDVDQEVSLTPTETRILRSLAAGMTPKDIAAEVGRSIYTVQTHIQNVIEKLGCHGRSEAIAAARRKGLLAGSNGST